PPRPRPRSPSPRPGPRAAARPPRPPNKRPPAKQTKAPAPTTQPPSPAPHHHPFSALYASGKAAFNHPSGDHSRPMRKRFDDGSAGFARAAPPPHSWGPVGGLAPPPLLRR